MTSAVRVCSARPATSRTVDAARIAPGEPHGEAGDRGPQRAGDPGEQREEQQQAEQLDGGEPVRSQHVEQQCARAERRQQRQAEEQRAAHAPAPEGRTHRVQRPGQARPLVDPGFGEHLTVEREETTQIDRSLRLGRHDEGHPPGAVVRHAARTVSASICAVVGAQLRLDRLRRPQAVEIAAGEIDEHAACSRREMPAVVAHHRAAAARRDDPSARRPMRRVAERRQQVGKGSGLPAGDAGSPAPSRRRCCRGSPRRSVSPPARRRPCPSLPSGCTQ